MGNAIGTHFNGGLHTRSATGQRHAHTKGTAQHFNLAAVEEVAVLQDLDGVSMIDCPLGDSDQRRHHRVDIRLAAQIEFRLRAPTIRVPQQEREAADDRDVPVESFPHARLAIHNLRRS